MNLSQIRAFHAIISEGNFSRAAKYLGVSQPAVTQQIKSLEEDVGQKLIIRGGRQIVLTETGKQIMYSVRQIISLMNNLELEVSSYNQLKGGNVTIGIGNPYVTMDILAEFSRRYPGLKIHTRMGNSCELLKLLEDYKADVSIVTMPEPSDKFYHFKFFEQRVVACVPRDHEWVAAGQVSLERLCQTAMVYREEGSMTRSIFERALMETKLSPNILLELGSREAVKEAVAAGLGVGIVLDGEFGEDPRIAPVTILDADLRAGEYIVCLPEFEKLRAIDELISIAKAKFSAKGPKKAKKTDDETSASN